MVTWEDAYHHETGGAEDPGDWHYAYSPRVVESVGWVLRADKKVVALSSWKMCNDDSYRNAMYIPRGMVRKVRRIKT